MDQTSLNRLWTTPKGRTGVRWRLVGGTKAKHVRLSATSPTECCVRSRCAHAVRRPRAAWKFKCAASARTRAPNPINFASSCTARTEGLTDGTDGSTVSTAPLSSINTKDRQQTCQSGARRGRRRRQCSTRPAVESSLATNPKQACCTANTCESACVLVRAKATWAACQSDRDCLQKRKLACESA